MAARWRLLTDYLLGADTQVLLPWAEFDSIVRGLPRSAIDHYPGWWQGDRPNTRAWRAAGYRAAQVDPGVAVTFVRTGTQSPDTTDSHLSRGVPPSVARGDGTDPMSLLRGIDPSRCLIVIPCSASKRRGGQAGAPAIAPGDLEEARRRVLSDPKSQADESFVMPAWQRYNGHLYRAAAPVVPELASTGRLLVLSGGYGLLESTDLIGDYDRKMRVSDWPRGLLERSLSERAAGSGLNVLAVASTSTDYAEVLRRTSWRLDPGCTAHLLTLQGVRGATSVLSSLGHALRTFITGKGDYPASMVIERLDA